MNVRRATLFDLRPVQSLLTAAKVPFADMAEHFGGFMVGEEGSAIVAAGGVESHGNVGLLRSLVVTPGRQRQGLGRALAENLIADARERGIGDLYLLTINAQGFFARLGFATIARAEAPPAISGSREFSAPAAESAVLMRLAASR